MDRPIAEIPEEYSTKHIKFKDTSDDLAEIYQTTNIEFALVNDGGEQVHTFVQCRDFLQDCYWGYSSCKNVSIYGFNWNFTKDPNPSKTKISVMVRDLTRESWENDIKMEAALDLIHAFERVFFNMKSNYNPSRVKRIKAPKDGESDYYIFEGSMIWLHTPFFMSLYTLLIRLGEYELPRLTWRALKKELLNLSPDDTNDAKYMKVVMPDISKIIRYRNFLFGPSYPGWTAKISIDRFHEHSGILSLCNGDTFDAFVNKDITTYLKKKP